MDNKLAMSSLLPSDQNGMASCTPEGYLSLYHTNPPYYTDRLYGYDFSECLPIDSSYYSIPAMADICRSSSDVPSQELRYVSTSSVLSETTSVQPDGDASYAFNNYPFL